MEKTIKINFGRTYEIQSHKQHQFLVGRLMVVTKLSKKEGFVNGHLYNPKTGEYQKSEIAIPLINIMEVGLPAIIPPLPKPTGKKVITPLVIALGPGVATKTKKIKKVS